MMVRVGHEVLQHPDFHQGFAVGLNQYHLAHADQILSDAELWMVCLHICQETRFSEVTLLGVLTGWLVQVARLAPLPALGGELACPVARRVPPQGAGRVMPLGQSVVRLTQGDTFCNGYLAGHLSYMLAYRASSTQRVPASLTDLLLATCHQDAEEAIRQTGFVAGWLLTAYRRQVLAIPSGTIPEEGAP